MQKLLSAAFIRYIQGNTAVSISTDLEGSKIFLNVVDWYNTQLSELPGVTIGKLPNFATGIRLEITKTSSYFAAFINVRNELERKELEYQQLRFNSVKATLLKLLPDLEFRQKKEFAAQLEACFADLDIRR